jgi:hypothetical protein
MGMEYLTAFESIGDNCEFGLAQKMQGFDEGALFKWARLPDVRQLTRLLECDFRRFYLFENLKPMFDDMVEDSEYGMLFHSDLSSQKSGDGRRWSVVDEGARREIYDIEYNKRIYLIEKLKAAIAADDKIFVFKKNDGVDPTEIAALHRALCRYGDGNLLYIEKAADGSTVGEIAMVSKGLWRGYIPRFAPYWPVTDYLPGAWERICEEAITKIRVVAHGS